MIKTHSEEPLKSPALIIESLIGAYSPRKVFSGGKKKSFREATITMPAALCMSNLYRPSPLFPSYAVKRESLLMKGLMYSLESPFLRYLEMN